jgi:hypothetical protein
VVAADYLQIKIRAALARLAAAHPTLDFGVPSAEVHAAETGLNAAWSAWPKGGKLSDVWRALEKYRDALLAANRVQLDFFGGSPIKQEAVVD